MKRIGLKMSGIMYETKRQYPFLVQLEKRMDTVKKELNRGGEKKK